MKSAVASAIFFAASIAVAVAYPSRSYYGPVSYDDGEYPGGRSLWAGQPSYTLSSAPFFYQPRTLNLEDAESRGRKYKIVKKKKNQGSRGSGSDEEEDDEPQDDDDEESSEEEEDEEEDEEQSLDVPAWEKLFPEEDKNTGTFDDQGGAGPGYGGGEGGSSTLHYNGGQGQGGPSGYSGEGQGSGGYGGSLANLPGGAQAPQGSGGLMSLFTGGSSNSGGGGGGGNGPQDDHGGPPQYRQGRPPQHRGRTSFQDAEEPRSGGAVLYDGYRYIPVNPVHVQLGQRQAKKIKPNKQKKEKTQGRSLRPSASSTRQTKKLNTNSNNNNKKIVLVPVPPRDSREIRFSRDEEGLRVESGPMYAPTEIWRWEGPGGRPLRRRENRPSGLYYAPRPQRGSASSVRFAEENDY